MACGGGCWKTEEQVRRRHIESRGILGCEECNSMIERRTQVICGNSTNGIKNLIKTSYIET